MNKASFMSYLNSRDFIVDFMVVRTGEDSVEWTSFRGKSGKRLEWMNGTLRNVSSAVRKRGTMDEFAEYIELKLQKNFKADPEFRYCREEVCSTVNCMPITKMSGVRR